MCAMSEQRYRMRIVIEEGNLSSYNWLSIAGRQDALFSFDLAERRKNSSPKSQRQYRSDQRIVFP